MKKKMFFYAVDIEDFFSSSFLNRIGAFQAFFLYWYFELSVNQILVVEEKANSSTVDTQWLRS